MADEKKATAKAEPNKLNGTVQKNHDAEGDSGVGQVQRITDEINAKGYFGNPVDPTPDENYTLAGVNKGLPTPETDDEAKLAADDRHRKLSEDPLKGK